MAEPVPVTIALDAGRSVSGLLMRPADARACYVLAHGAGAGMTHPFMAAVAVELAERRIATLRFQFPAMEQGSHRVDRPAIAQATVQAAVAAARTLLPGLPLIAGGKSFGGRMTSHAQADQALPDVRGLAFLGFPLHPAGKPAIERAHHLADVALPMLFVQGTRDALADLPLITQVVAELGKRATLVQVDGADHGFHVPIRSGRTDAQARAAMLDAFVAWVRAIL